MPITKKATAFILPITIVSLALISANNIGAQENKDSAENELTEKERKVFGKAIANRKAGKPQNCIRRGDQKNMTVVSDDVLIFGSSRNAKTIYVNKPAGGCPSLKHNTLIYKRTQSSLCTGNIADVVDLQSNVQVGGCAFGQFIPYTKIDK